jgi:hypothetical protein
LVTRQRIARGETIIAEDAGIIVGTITLANRDHTHGSAFYRSLGRVILSLVF